MEFSFKENTVVPALDAVPDHARPFYSPEAGENGHELLPEFSDATKAFDNLNKALSNARKAEREMRREKLGSWLELGETPDSVRAEIEELRAQIKDGSKSGVNMDKMKKEFEAAKKAILDEADAEKKTMLSSLEMHMVKGQAASAIAAEKGDVELLLPHVLKSTKLVNESGDWQVRVIDTAGDPRGDGKGGFMSVPDLVREMKTSYGRAFDAEDRAGAGTGSNGRDSGRPVPDRSGNRSPVDKIRSGLSSRIG